MPLFLFKEFTPPAQRNTVGPFHKGTSSPTVGMGCFPRARTQGSNKGNKKTCNNEYVRVPRYAWSYIGHQRKFMWVSQRKQVP